MSKVLASPAIASPPLASPALASPSDEAVIQCSPCGRPCAARRIPWILAATILGSSMAILDGTAVNVALPILQAELGGTVADVQWVVESYALCLGALILVGGALGDRHGRRRVFCSGVVLFAAASIWCGVSPTVGQLIMARAVQGIGASLMVPGSLAILSSAFDDAQRGRAIGTWSAATAMAAAFGPVLGGWLVEHVSWRWVFYINIPLAIVVVAISLRYVPESRDTESKHGLDVGGALLVTGGLGALVYGLIESARLGLGHPAVIAGLAAGAIMLVAFVRQEARSRAPMMPLGLFRSRTFSGANGLTFLLYAALAGGLFFLPFNLIQVQGYSPTAAGAALLPFILLISSLSRWAGGLVHRFGARLPLTVGPLIAAIGFALFARPGVGGSYWVTFFPAVVVLGLGMAISVAPLTTTVMGAVPARQSGLASGINNAMARVAGLLAIALLGVVALGVFETQLDADLDRLAVSQDLRRQLEGERIKLAGATVPVSAGPDLGPALQRAIDESFVSAFRVVMLIAAAMAAAGGMSAALTIDRPVLPSRP